MFAIYDNTGRQFRDSLENLYKVRQMQASHGTKLQPDVRDEGRQHIPDLTSGEKADAAVSSMAQQTYREMRNINQREPIYHAYQLMSSPVSTVRTEMEILAARRYFQQQGFHQMPVINAQQRLVGMLSVNDLLRFIIIDGEQVSYLGGKHVSDAMSQEVITADPVSDIRRIAHVMRQYRLHSVPIVDERDALIGIVSRGDILKAVTNDPPLDMWT